MALCKRSVAPSTLKARQGQWACYVRFCKGFSLAPLPCTIERAILFVTYMSSFMKAQSILAYLHGIVFHHLLEGHPPPDLSDKKLKAVLKGVASYETAPSRQKDPITVNHLRRMYRVVDTSDPTMITMWAAILFLFRTLLRVSHVTVSPHTLCTSDVSIEEWGLVVQIRSSKTKKRRDRPFSLPVARCSDLTLCPVYWLERVRSTFSPAQQDPLFPGAGKDALSYGVFASALAALIKGARIKGDFASHSLRRGGATMMAQNECSLLDIKTRGQWSSDCVFQYLKPSLEHLKEKDSELVNDVFC